MPDSSPPIFHLKKTKHRVQRLEVGLQHEEKKAQRATASHENLQQRADSQATQIHGHLQKMIDEAAEIGALRRSLSSSENIIGFLAIHARVMERKLRRVESELLLRESDLTACRGELNACRQRMKANFLARRIHPPQVSSHSDSDPGTINYTFPAVVASAVFLLWWWAQ